jgi:hypothetical protein
MPKNISKLKSSKGVEKLPNAKAREGAWKSKLVSATLANGHIHKGKEIAPVVEEAMITDIANGLSPTQIEHKYEVSAGHARSVLLRRFGNKEKMKEALTLMCYENAMAFMGYAADKITEFTGPQAVLASKLAIESGLALEKTEQAGDGEVDFTGLMVLGSTLKRLEGRVLLSLPSPTN